MGFVLEVRAPGLARVPGLLERAQFGDDAVGGIDGVGAGAHVAHVHGMAAHFHLEPQHADVGANEFLVLGLRDQHGIGAIAPQVRHEGAVAGRFLLDHGLYVERGGRLQADAGERIKREHVGRRADLHVRPAAPVEPVALDDGIEGRMRPHVGGARRHHVGVRLQDQRAAGFLARVVDADHDRGRGMLGRPGRAAGMPLDRLAVHGEAIHGVASAGQCLEYEILHRVLGTAGRGEADQSLREGDLVVETLRHGGDDLVAELRIERHWDLVLDEWDGRAARDHTAVASAWRRRAGTTGLRRTRHFCGKLRSRQRAHLSAAEAPSAQSRCPSQHRRRTCKSNQLSSEPCSCSSA